MYILLEPGMEIKAGDEAYITDEEGTEKWVNSDLIGDIYYNDLVPIRRKIETIDELVETLKTEKQKQGK